MKTLLKEFRGEFRERVLDLLWRQWISLGVSGHGQAWTQSVIDPDALLLASGTIARHDPRLFDAMLDWLEVNGTFVNVNRIHRMLKEGSYAGEAVFASVASVIRATNNAPKWSRSATVQGDRCNTDEALFHMADGSPLPIVGEPDPVFQRHGFLRDRYLPRDTASAFNPELPANLLLRLRAFLGVNARCEILAYLLLNGSGSPRVIARACGYYPATVSKALSEMGASGYLSSRIDGRYRYYNLNSGVWSKAILEGATASWVNWIPLFGALEQIWLFLHTPGRDTQAPLAQASDLRRLLNATIMNQIAESQLAIHPGDHTRHTGEALLPFFTNQVTAILDRFA